MTPREEAQTYRTGGSRSSRWRGPAVANAKNTEQISEFGRSGGLPPGKFFFDNAKCCKLGHFYHFCQAFGEGHGPAGPPFGAAYAKLLKCLLADGKRGYQ